MRLLAASLLAGLVESPSSLRAADPTPKTPEKAVNQSRQPAEKAKPKRDWYPFAGIVVSVNKQANTISLGKKEGMRVLKLDSKTRLEIDGRTAVLSSVNVGEYAHGRLRKDSEGKEVILDAKFDKEAPPKKTKARDPQPQKTPAPKSE